MPDKTQEQPRLRADARANIEKLRLAAIEVFREQGLGVPLDEIALRAHVSPGTLYNRFGSREALIDSVVEELASDYLVAAANDARSTADPFDRFALYVEKLCELQAVFPDLNDVIARKYPGSRRLAELCDSSLVYAAEFITSAQAAKSLRADFTVDDLFLFFTANAAVVAATRATGPDIWRRNVGFIIDGLRSEAARPLPTQAVACAPVLEHF
ncbi:TetR/AcrR family transcriptional regulator [Subtercola endophyticus]|uniref:TetR/AcrR family transcriptional regulator n=1 Tax=Subtercola endophyticus TaxID=2895559 RepID=UPI001E2FFA66|nr:TetR/AcrR family transcriptional regulator [Subtercola endophyticus]UFS58184.1 TetR/AcrR family transcriptional regulator [Subtercola endophyticus]